MRAWILGVALTGATGGGVAFVLAGKPEQSHGGPPVQAQSNNVCTDTACPSCLPTPPADAADVTDVTALLAAAVDTTRPGVSFDEPPFALPAKAIRAEVAPRPRAVAEEGPMPRLTPGEQAPMPRALE